MTHSNYGRFSVDADWNKLAKGRGYDDRFFEDNWGLYQDPRDKSGNYLRDQDYWRKKHGKHSWSKNKNDKVHISQTYTIKPDQLAGSRDWLEKNKDKAWNKVQQPRGHGSQFLYDYSLGAYEQPYDQQGGLGPADGGGPGMAGQEQVGGGGYSDAGRPSPYKDSNRGGPGARALAKMWSLPAYKGDRWNSDNSTERDQRRAWWKDMVEDKGRALYQSLQTQWAAKNAYRQAKEYRATGWGY